MNTRLGKPLFDCNDLDATYDCGCGDDPDETTASPSKTVEAGLGFDINKDKVTGVGMIKGGR